jgi:hypothetical protein
MSPPVISHSGPNSYLCFLEHFCSCQSFFFDVVSTSVELHNILKPTMGVTFFNSGSKSDPTELFLSIVLVIAGEKRFPLPNFNLKIIRIQRGGGSWMLLDALLHY